MVILKVLAYLKFKKKNNMIDNLNDNDTYGWEGTTQENMVKYIETVRSYDDDEKFKTFRSNLHSTGILEGVMIFLIDTMP